MNLGQGGCWVGGKDRKLALKGVVPLAVTAAGLVAGKEALGRRAMLESAEAGKAVTLNNRPYRGRVELFAGADGQMTAVNALPVDEYVQGILVREASPSWPGEALKAQAVVSRTYALRN